MKKLITLIFTFFIICVGISAQFITEIRYNQYSYEGNSYKKQDLSFAFEEGTESHRIYNEALQLRKQTKKLLRAAGFCFIAGNLFLYAAGGYNTTAVVGILSGYILAPVMTLVAIPGGQISRSKFHRAFKMHAFEYYETHGYKKDQSHLDLGISTNGIGLFYTF